MTHELSIRNNGCWLTAHCSCGWLSGGYGYASACADAWADHVEES